MWLHSPRNSYLRAISKDPDLPRISDHLIAPKNHALGIVARSQLGHPRIKEVLGVASADQNTELIDYS